MKIWPVVAVAVMSTACFNLGQPSLQPFVTEKDALALPQIVGTWVQEGDDPDVIRFRAADDKTYEVSTVWPAGETPKRGTLVVAFGRIGDQLYLDMTARPLDDEDDAWSIHRLPIHTFARVRLDGDRLEVAAMSDKWVTKGLEDSTLDLPHTTQDDTVILTATSDELAQFALAHADDEGAFLDPDVYTRQSTR